MRRRILAVFAIVTLPASCTAWLLRDPVPYFESRRDTAFRSSVLAQDSAADHVNERVQLDAINGLRVQMILRRPRAESGVVRRPLFIVLGGYETGDRAATLIPHTHGNIIAALAYPYDGDLGVKGFAVLPAVPKLRKAVLDTPPAIMLAIDYLLSRGDVDSSRIELVGASFGTPFSTVVGALDPRVSRVWSVHGAAWPYRQIEHNLQARIDWAPARQVVAGLATLFASGWRLDPEDWAPRISPRPFIMINAREDERMPRDAVDALYASARAPKDMIWLDGPHLQSNRKAVLSGLVETVLRRAATP
ncbi:MAG: hypothetical protein ACT4P7_03120 [Gemmatimonadaceae bacterium]